MQGKVYDINGLSPTICSGSTIKIKTDSELGQHIDDGKPIVVGNTTLCNHATGNVYHPNGISRTLMAGNYKAPITIIEKENEGEIDEVIGSTRKNAAHTDGTYSPSLTCAMGQGGGHVPMIKQKNNQQDICQPVLTPDRVSKRQNGRRMKEDGEPSFTLTATDKHGVYDGFRSFN